MSDLVPASPERSIAILGPGLLGGSIAMAVKALWPAVEVRMWGRRAEAVQAVQSRGVADFASTDAAEVVRSASMVVLAVPVPAMAGLMSSCIEALAPDAVVTDVGSVKQSVLAALEPMFAGRTAAFVGSHPMAGSEQTGLDAASADLFAKATCIITPTAQTRPEAQQRVERFWQGLGCHLLTMPAAEHDRKVARISHLPHAVAFALVQAALKEDPTAAACAGKGFRDTTRIAGSDPDLWTGILLENQTEVAAALEDVLARTQDLLAFVRSADKEQLRQFIAEAQQLKRSSRRTH